MKLYLFKGKRIEAVSKDDVLRKAGLKCNTKNYQLVMKLKRREYNAAS
jgi:hypothetical protein